MSRLVRISIVLEALEDSDDAIGPSVTVVRKEVNSVAFADHWQSAKRLAEVATEAIREELTDERTSRRNGPEAS